MKTFVTILLAAAVSAGVVRAEDQEKKEDETLAEKASQTLDTTREKTKEASRAVVDTTKRAADAVVDALTPDADARKVDVKLSDDAIAMPTELESGKTAFVVRNAGKEKHNFEVEGGGIDKKFFAPVEPDETKVLHVELKSGTYKVFCPLRDNAKKGMKLKLVVR
jgi:plastocyanin